MKVGFRIPSVRSISIGATVSELDSFVEIRPGCKVKVISAELKLDVSGNS